MSTAPKRNTPLLSDALPEPLSREDIVVGRDVIELLSSGMYTDPLTIYREYVQNCADSIDRARAEGLLGPDQGTVFISIDAETRAVRIRDDGTGIGQKDFIRRLASLGASSKRGLGERGFRGVGRLSGLAYAQELVFRTRTGSKTVLEMRWDCRRLRALLRVAEGPADIAELMTAVVTVRSMPAAQDLPLRFFEVELLGVARIRGDRLMNPILVMEYLSQVAPVPFSQEFSYAGEIQSVLAAAGVRLGNICLEVNGAAVWRPHRNMFELANGRQLAHEEVEFFEVAGTDERLAAVGWMLHHPYEGALPNETLIKGFRARVGNIQVGEPNLLDDLFAEPRFNAWTVGEIHIVDARIVPNGRRDGFEQDAHFANLSNRLSPFARAVSRRCRASSTRRKAIRDAEAALQDAEASVVTLKQNAIGDAAWLSTMSSASRALARADRLSLEFNAALPGRIPERVAQLQVELSNLDLASSKAAPLASIPSGERRSYERVIELIYDCSRDRAMAAELVDKILYKLTLSSI